MRLNLLTILRSNMKSVRRAGDLPEFWANSEKAEKVLGWKTKRTLEDMCRDTWNWQKNNPQGYK